MSFNHSRAGRSWTGILLMLTTTWLSACGETRPADVASPVSPEASVANGDLIGQGERFYQETCAACHGRDLNGTRTGPPFLDPIYAPDHHPDESFFAAAENGVQPHHWDFGPMPAQPTVSRDEVAAIVAYVRSRQVEAGIIQDPSH